MFSFFRSAKEELSRVTWLTQKQAFHVAWVTLLFIVAATIFVGGVDALFSLIIKSL